MKSVYINNHGSRNVLTYGELPENTPKPKEVKVKIRSCSLNRLDIFTRMGIKGIKLDFTKPHILGGDFAGEIIEVGNQVTDKKIGGGRNPNYFIGTGVKIINDVPQVI